MRIEIDKVFQTAIIFCLETPEIPLFPLYPQNDSVSRAIGNVRQGSQADTKQPTR